MDVGVGFLAICFAILGFAAYIHIETLEDKSHGFNCHTLFNKVPAWFWLTLLTIFCIRTGLWASRSSHVSYHPIDMLIYDAQSTHEAFVGQASTSKTLAEAVKTYRERYNKHPPPGFDHWYRYATERNSLIIDDFDSVYRDLLPFYALSPETIRHRTWQIISNPWHDCAGISIRAGKVNINTELHPTHRWMLDGLVQMIGQFSEWLPDMDLTFNINDEPRVAVQYNQIERMRDIGEHVPMLGNECQNAFSENRAEQWKPIPEKPNTERVNKEISWQKMYYEFGNVACPPGSPALDQRLWDVGRLCTSCFAPHSMGAFVSNWTIAADVCHQPDLANLHGIYIAPAAFKGSYKLYPFFSQSKIHGFNDILYPSAWNYIEKTKYNPTDEHPDLPYANKTPSVFWRGATSEGVSQGQGQWKAMTRQRFVHLANDINGTDGPQSILLPRNTSAAERKLVYEPVPISDLTKLISIDVHVVDNIGRCGGIDCLQQAAEFAPLVPHSDFQAHWRFKYLLDLDGAGFSGRFLPFLASHSLPFKAALFREWWDDRVTAWQHFVPLDVRGHGFWATLAHFAGFEGTVKGRFVRLEAHERQGERIAEEGRSWADRVLRKEDMEVYFFRLLLEWGRLTDDRRESIGFGVDVEAG